MVDAARGTDGLTVLGDCALVAGVGIMPVGKAVGHWGWVKAYHNPTTQVSIVLFSFPALAFKVLNGLGTLILKIHANGKPNSLRPNVKIFIIYLPILD